MYKSLKIAIILGLLFIFLACSFLWYVFYGPRWGTMHYGVCKVFAERHIDFPHTMKVRSVDYYKLTARVTIGHVDASGQFYSDVYECEFASDSLKITRVRINRKLLSDIKEDSRINPQILEKFNQGIDAILLNPPSLLLPRSIRGVPINSLWAGQD